MSEPERDGLTARIRQQTPIPLDADLSCAPGELLALVGPSGSGKTTILRCIAGLDRPPEGRIVCDGEIWFDATAGHCLPPQQRRVGLVFQDYALFPHLSALDTVAIALGHLPRRERPARARELLALVHLAGLEERRPHELSGGQRQRVALARALARDPVVLLLDEPFAAVDQVTRRRLQRELVLLRRAVRIPMVLVTHDLSEASALADRLCVLYRGRTLQTGPPGEVLNHPRDPLVARLMDQTNVFEGVVRERRPDGVLLLDWRGRLLEVRDRGAFPVGAKVSWMIPPSHIVLHRRGRPSLGERENPVPGTVGEMVELGETTSVTMWVDGDPERPLNFTVATHAARRNALAPGADLRVSLLAEGIHLMPPGPSESDEVAQPDRG